jgi:hypothetical protein
VDNAVIHRGLSPHQVSRQPGWSRREFLRTAGLTLGGALSRSPFPAASIAREKKVVVVTFGGGARDQETFDPEGQQNIPNMMQELIPRAAFFTQVVNRGILGHYVATASLATGAYESINNFAAIPPENPTAFEYYRKDRKRPSSDAWVVAPSNGFNRIGESNHRFYGPGFGARVILPKYLLKAAISGSGPDYEHLLRDNYENPYYTPELENREFELEQMETILKLSATDFKLHAKTLSSPDELSLFIVRQLIRQVAPSFLWITMHDIDVAHAGAYSLYMEGIRRTDRLCAELWKLLENEPEYSGKTTLLILPDFGRDADDDAGGNGFQHHRTGDPVARTTWLMAIGQGIHEGVIYDRTVESIDLVPTLGKMLGFTASFSQGRPISELV